LLVVTSPFCIGVLAEILSVAGTYVMGHSEVAAVQATLACCQPLTHAVATCNSLLYRIVFIAHRTSSSDELSETPDIKLYTNVIFLALYGFMVLYGGLLSREKKNLLGIYLEIFW
jgi:hypothetical protein